MTTEIIQCFQLSLVVDANFPRNWMISICTYKQNIRQCNKYEAQEENKGNRKSLTWSTRVTATIPIKRRFLVIPLKIFFSSGFRALNSLKICISNNYLFVRPSNFMTVTNQQCREKKTLLAVTMLAASSCPRNHNKQKLNLTNYCIPWWFTNLAKDKRIEYQSIFYFVGMGIGITLQVQNPLPLKIQDKQDTYLVGSLKFLTTIENIQNINSKKKKKQLEIFLHNNSINYNQQINNCIYLY